MSPVTFKPQQQVSRWDPNVKNVLWTEERDAIPQILKGRVDLATWQATFDAVVEQYETLINPLNCALRIPPFCFVTWPYLKIRRHMYENRWRQVLREQAQIYQHLGIKVTLVQEPRRRRGTMTVGLKFEQIQVTVEAHPGKLGPEKIEAEATVIAVE